MSIGVMTAVWKHANYSGGALLTLLALADFSSDEGYSFPSIPTLAQKTRMTERGVRQILIDLTQDKAITVTHGGGRGVPNAYQINLKMFQGKENPENVSLKIEVETLKMDAQNPENGCSAYKEEPSCEPSIEPSGKPPAKKRAKKPQLSDEEWLASLEADPTYRHVNIRVEYGKMVRWCEVKRRRATRPTFINWINRIDPPLRLVHSAPATPQPPRPPCDKCGDGRGYYYDRSYDPPRATACCKPNPLAKEGTDARARA